MLRVEKELNKDYGEALDESATPEVQPVDVAAYETWRATRDIEEVMFRFESAREAAPAALYRLESFVRSIAERRNAPDAQGSPASAGDTDADRSGRR